MDQYKLGKRLGGGAFSDVYCAEDRSYRRVALKRVRLLDNRTISFYSIREASLLYALKHENIVRLLCAFTHGIYFYMALEYLDMDLSAHMGWGDFEYPTIIKPFLRQILAGLRYCHSHGVIHRDLKPANLLVDITSNTIKLGDFGLARGFLADDMMSPRVGTRSYKAPEILLAADHYSFPVDIWSVGCIFGEMVTKMPLFPGQSDIDVVHKIFEKMGTPTEEVWPGVSDLPGFQIMLQGPHYQPQDLADILRPRGLDDAGLDLLSNMLCLDPTRRITAVQALEHEYFAN